MSAEHRHTTIFYNETEGQPSPERVFIDLVSKINRDSDGSQRLVVLNIASPPLDDKTQHIGDLEVWPEEDDLYLLRYFKEGEDEVSWGAKICRDGDVAGYLGIEYEQIGLALQALIMKRRTPQGIEYGFKYFDYIDEHLQTQSADLPVILGQELDPNPNLYITSMELDKLDYALEHRKR